ncbi:hypothetical protein Aros01_05329 [Streptosporangium roseum]|uniref:Uncharacterized protein n=1 Tax=Streptosporangium roseum (strain ATCC 12428 / DSM 43021 / JCM 3005 / KCTC 9067 / NCIMB 10171 / NRRL 2505 / NI 9100) TaxID=479432 RepID=D2B920_STRRD|nr:hypothetical protein Sros_7079 [Streptosporangium roseum DSM 43021]
MTPFPARERTERVAVRYRIATRTGYTDTPHTGPTLQRADGHRHTTKTEGGCASLSA